jgi:hypothetical protein
MGNGIVGAIFVLFIAALIFLVCRAIVLWYWRVGEAIDLLKGINEKLGRIAEQQSANPSAGERVREQSLFPGARI